MQKGRILDANGVGEGIGNEVEQSEAPEICWRLWRSCIQEKHHNHDFAAPRTIAPPWASRLARSGL